MDAQVCGVRFADDRQFVFFVNRRRARDERGGLRGPRARRPPPALFGWCYRATGADALAGDGLDAAARPRDAGALLAAGMQGVVAGAEPPPPGNREMIIWITPDAAVTVDDAKKMVAA